MMEAKPNCFYTKVSENCRSIQILIKQYIGTIKQRTAHSCQVEKPRLGAKGGDSDLAQRLADRQRMERLQGQPNMLLFIVR